MGDRIIIIRNGNREDNRPRTLDGDLQSYSRKVCAGLNINLCGRRRGNRD